MRCRTTGSIPLCALSATGGFDCSGAWVSGAEVNASRNPGGIKSTGDGLPVTLLGVWRAIFVLRSTIKWRVNEKATYRFGWKFDLQPTPLATGMEGDASHERGNHEYGVRVKV